MERTKEKTKAPTGDNEITWRKIGRGSLRFKGRIIKPGENFKARPSELSDSIRRFLMPLGEVVEKASKAQEPDKKAELTEFIKVPRGKSKLWYDVVNTKVVTEEFPKGKPMNEKALTKDKAEAFIASLTA